MAVVAAAAANLTLLALGGTAAAATGIVVVAAVAAVPSAAEDVTVELAVDALMPLALPAVIAFTVVVPPGGGCLEAHARRRAIVPRGVY